MMDPREATFLKVITDFPDSPMGYFSLGRLYLDAKRYADAVTRLSEAVRLDPNYSAAWVALGDAHGNAGEKEQAKAAYERALATPHGQRDGSLQGDLAQRLQDLADF
jgi:tetratricopeptide (TPR) repeat protein